jgi:hypothetical protein
MDLQSRLSFLLAQSSGAATMEKENVRNIAIVRPAQLLCQVSARRCAKLHQSRARKLDLHRALL